MKVQCVYENHREYGERNTEARERERELTRPARNISILCIYNRRTLVTQLLAQPKFPTSLRVQQGTHASSPPHYPALRDSSVNRKAKSRSPRRRRSISPG